MSTQTNDRAPEPSGISLAAYQTALEQSPASVLITDNSNRILYVNPAFERNTGYAAVEVLGKNPRILKSGEQKPEFYQELWSCLRENRSWEGEFHNRHKDGTLYWEHATISPLTDPTGQPFGYVAVKLNITRQKEMEAELREAKKMAENASQSKSDFLANMSHEIRTPMNGVMGMLELLLDTSLDTNQRRYAEVARSSGDALLTLLNDILDYSKIEAGKLELYYADFNLRDELDNLSEAMAVQAHTKGLELICYADPDVPGHLHGDHARIRQILVNLLGNAIKFTTKGEVVLRVTRDPDRPTQIPNGIRNQPPHDPVRLRFSVSDTGIGIAAEKQHALFQKFTQLDSSTTRKHGGTGLGLAISRQLVELMGGEIGATSIEGDGACFWFSISLDQQAGIAIKPQSKMLNMPVLIIDDNPASRAMFAIHFTHWGMKPEEAPDNETALAMIKQKPPGYYALFLVDRRMPGLACEPFAETVRSHPGYAYAPMILFSSIGDPHDDLAARNAGYHACMTKPPRMRDVHFVAFRLLASRGAPKSQPSTEREAVVKVEQFRFINHPHKLLLVEDNLINREVALGLLNRLGLKAEIAENGAEALKRIEQKPFDLVLMDVQMPVMDGLEATRLLREKEKANGSPRLPVIAMTAHAMVGDRERCLNAGMDEYLTKPLSPENLSSILVRWLSAEHNHTLAPPSSQPVPPPALSATNRDDIQVFDRNGLTRRLMGDEELATRIMGQFCEDIPRQINLLHEQLERKDARAVERQAHTIKGASANIGGEALRLIAFDVEKTAKAGNLDTAQQLMKRLQTEFDRLKAAMMGPHA